LTLKPHSFTDERPVEILAGQDGKSHWLYPGLLAAVVNDGETMEDAATGFEKVDWTLWDFDIVGRCVEFLLQFDYSTYLDSEEEEVPSSPVMNGSAPGRGQGSARRKFSGRGGATTRKKMSTHAAKRSYNSATDHDPAYKAKWDEEDQTSELPVLGPFSVMDSFLSEKACKDWMLSYEGWILNHKAGDATELEHRAIVVHAKMYAFAAAHEFELLQDVAVQKLVMCLSRTLPTPQVCSAIAEAVEVLCDAGFDHTATEHHKIHQVLTHYTAAELGKFDDDTKLARKPFLKRAKDKLMDWINTAREDRARIAELEKQLQEVAEQLKKERIPEQRNFADVAEENTLDSRTRAGYAREPLKKKRKHD
jgi:hypothetical protein